MTPVQEILRSRLDILMKEISELSSNYHTIQEVRLIFQMVWNFMNFMMEETTLITQD